VREFKDEDGMAWVASIQERPGDDYKGRYFFRMESKEDPSRVVELVDVRWNSPKTAERTLRTMSEVELRRRLRSARGRNLSRTGAPSP